MASVPQGTYITAVHQEVGGVRVSKPVTLIFYQYVTDLVFKELIKLHFPVVGQLAP